MTTAIAVPAIFTALNNGRNGWGLMKQRYLFALGVTGVTFIISHFGWHRYVGYNNQSVLEQTYAKNVKMLRNLIIKQ